MTKKNTVFIGFGDLAYRTCEQLAGNTVGISRSIKPVPAGLKFVRGELMSATVLSYLSKHHFDTAVITLTPAVRSDLGYKQGYVEPMEALLAAWSDNPPGRVIFVSSTSVYGQALGEWVDEGAECAPVHFSGQRLLQAEQLLLASDLPHYILRLAGIYGAGRDFLQRLVVAGEGGNSDFTNRIHVDDAARFIAQLINSKVVLERGETIINLSDSEPARSCDVRAWLAKKMGFGAAHLASSGSSRGGNKRCSNSRMLATGFELQYPTYREGYAVLLAGEA